MDALSSTPDAIEPELDAGRRAGDAMVPFDNRLRRAERMLRPFPGFLRKALLTWAYRIAVPFFGAAKAHVEEVSEHEVVVRVGDRRKVRNHVGGVHAVAMALSAETATGLLVAMNLPDHVVPLLTKMNINYVHRTRGDLVARARIRPEQARRLQREPRGRMAVSVEVIDDTGGQPIVCEMVWAWRQLNRLRAK